MSLQKSLYLTDAEQWAHNLETGYGTGWGFFNAEPTGRLHPDGGIYRLLLEWQEQDGTEGWSETSLDVKLLALAFAVAVLEAE
jgi:hypothetical protein